MKQIFLVIILFSLYLLSGCQKGAEDDYVYIDPVFGKIYKDETLPREAYIHPSFGLIIKDELLIGFKDAVTEGGARSYIEKLPGLVVSVNTRKVYHVRLQGSVPPSEFEKLLDQIRESSLVDWALPNGTVGAN